MQDLRTLFINIHHILNEYRPHQARESAIELMQDHLDRTRTETVTIRTQVDKAKRILEGLGSMGLVADATNARGIRGANADKGGAAGEERDGDAWASADAIFS